MRQIEKNTVDGTNQLKRYVTYEHVLEQPKLKVMFVGNSITLHGIKHDIGWDNNFGMAASAKENDYVHICMEYFLSKENETTFCICQVSEWETRYKDGEKYLPLYTDACNFKPDVIIMRVSENCPIVDFDASIFLREYKKLLNFLNSSSKAYIVLTTSFWKHPADEIIKELADEYKFGFSYMGDLGENDEMKAIGMFEHKGVSNHPGDKGMKTIATRIINAFKAQENVRGRLL